MRCSRISSTAHFLPEQIQDNLTHRILTDFFSKILFSSEENKAVSNYSNAYACACVYIYTHTLLYIYILEYVIRVFSLHDT